MTEKEELALTHRHKKRGTEYVLIGFGKMQAENWRDDDAPPQPGSDGCYCTHHPDDPAHTGACYMPPSVDMREVAIYRSVDDGSLWVRPREEFEDGRFEEIAPARSIDAGDGYVLVPREPTEAMKTAGMDVLMYRIETITPSDLWRAMLAAAHSPPPAKKVGPTTNAAAFELSIYEGVRDRLARLTAGTCSCNTKSPELRYHSERCHYRVAREALDLLLAAPSPPAKEAE